VLLSDEVLTDVPTLELAAENQSQLDLPLGVLAGDAIRLQEVFLAVMADDLAQGFVCRGVLELGVEDGVDPVLAHQGTQAILPAEAGEDSALLRGRLTIEVKLGGSPGLQAVFELKVGADEGIAAVGIADGVEHLNLEIARLPPCLGNRRQSTAFPG